MPSLARPGIVLGLTAGLLLGLAAPGYSQQATVDEWDVPWPDSRPRDPYVAPDGRVWFVGQRADYAATFDPTTRQFERHDLPEGTGPHNLIVAPDGEVWFSGNRAAYIGRLDPATGRITRIPMPNETAHDPHTLVFDGSGHVWFTVQQGNFVGRVTIASGKVDLVPMPRRFSRPYGIVMTRDGRPWFTEFGRNVVATVDPETLTLHEVETPHPGSRVRRIGLASDGSVWYVDYQLGYLGRYDPATGDKKEWAAPSGAGSRPYGMAVDDLDRIWFVETGPQPNRLIGFDPATETFFSNTAIPSGGRTVRHIFFHRPTRSLWFGTDANTLARANLPPGRTATP